MLLLSLDRRWATAIRAVGLALVTYSVLNSSHAPSGHGRGIVVLVLLILVVASWAAWTVRAARDEVPLAALAVLTVSGGGLTGASPSSAASACVFIAVVTAAVRFGLGRAAWIGAAGILALTITTILYGDSAIGDLAYSLGLAAAALAAANARGSVQRAEQAELLLAQAQRSHEEQLRVVRLEESTRIAREIHDVLAHAMAGLTIQLEASAALLEQGADRTEVLERIRQAHGLARRGLQETRRAVGALRGEAPPVAVAVRALADEYRDDAGAPAELLVDGPAEQLPAPLSETIVRVVQEALTNVHRYARGAAVTIRLTIADQLELVVANGPGTPAPESDGGGYGIRGMRERAELLGGTLHAGAEGDGWQVTLWLPVGEARPREPAA